MASNNMYRVGDFVYFESSANAPYQIRRIDELNKTTTGAVEAKVACYFRRRDVSTALINQAEKYYVTGEDSSIDEDNDDEATNVVTANGSESTNGVQPPIKRVTPPPITEAQKHQLKHRELFLSRQIECLPATHIRGKCSVTLFNEAEPVTNYLNREEAFYYKLIYDPTLKTLQEDRGSMRIGSDHQSEIQSLLKSKSDDIRMSQSCEELVWTPSNSLTEQEMDMFCLLAKAVGTYGRAHDQSTLARQPLLLSAASAASRDMTRQHAHNLLHKANYDFNKALRLLMPGNQPVVYRDQLEDWSVSEANLFEGALDKYSKTFADILTDCLPWKTSKSIVELYYFWKTTDRYIRQRRTKLAAQEHKLKQVYIPNYSKPNPVVLYSGPDKPNRGCEGCGVLTSFQWYTWIGNNAPNSTCRLCSGCWSYWKRYGGLKNMESKAALHSARPSVNLNQAQSNDDVTMDSSEDGVLNNKSIAFGADHHTLTGDFSSGVTSTTPDDSTTATSNCKTTLDALVFFTNYSGTPRGTHCFRTPAVIRLARILCPHLVKPIQLARRPFDCETLDKLDAFLSADVVASHQAKLGEDDASMALSEQFRSYTALKIAANHHLARLSNPSYLLKRPRKILSLVQVVDNLANSNANHQRDTDNDASDSQPPPITNGPSYLKRPHSSMPLSSTHSAKPSDDSDEPSCKRSNQTIDGVAVNGNNHSAADGDDDDEEVHSQRTFSLTNGDNIGAAAVVVNSDEDDDVTTCLQSKNLIVASSSSPNQHVDDLATASPTPNGQQHRDEL